MYVYSHQEQMAFFPCVVQLVEGLAKAEFSSFTLVLLDYLRIPLRENTLVIDMELPLGHPDLLGP